MLKNIIKRFKISRKQELIFGLMDNFGYTQQELRGLSTKALDNLAKDLLQISKTKSVIETLPINVNITKM